MPRSAQSREGAIVAFFQSAPLGIAQVVHRLSGDALKARATAKPAKAPKVTAAPVSHRVVPPAVAAPAKPKVKRRKRRTKPVAAPLVTEAELNDPDTD